MLTNAYDTTVGKVNKSLDGVQDTIAALHVSRDLTPTTKDNVFVLTNETELGVKTFMFPITMQAYNRKLITVYDERPFRNKSNQIVQQDQITIMKLAAFLQQDVAEGNVTNLKNGRLLAAKAFADAVSKRTAFKANLSPNENLTYKVLLAYYFVSLIEENDTDLELVGLNVIRSIYGSEKSFIMGVIEDLPRMALLSDLLDGIHKNPALYKLKSVTLQDFTQLLGGLMFSSMGNKVIAAACEAPCLFMALVYGAARFRAYQKTPLGEALDPKYNKGTLESFIKNIDYAYDLNG